MSTQAPTIQQSELVGTCRTFGETGPLYEVLRQIDESTLLIEVIPSGEKVNYSLNEARIDPMAG